MKIDWHKHRFNARPTAVQTACRQCGRSMWLPKSKIGEYVTCGGECAKNDKLKKIESRARSCETCGSRFTPRQTQLRMGQGRFCSQKCNISIVVSWSSEEVKEKAKASKKLSKPTWIHKITGENSACWTGGKKASYARMKASGYIRDQNNKRRCFRRRSLPKGTIVALEQKQRMKCASCSCSLSKGYHLDHIIPISKRGLHEAGNVQLLCPPCNIKKANRMPNEWAAMNGRLL